MTYKALLIQPKSVVDPDPLYINEIPAIEQEARQKE
jgi:hypothetical protein